MFFIILLVVTFMLLIFAISTYVKFERLLKMTKNFPGPKGHFFIGVGLEFFNMKTSEFVPLMQKYHKQFGNFISARMGPYFIIYFGEPADIEVVLTSPKFITKSDDYGFLMPWLGTGLLTSTGKKWSQRRKIITPTFHFKILEQFIETFDHQSDILIEKLRDKMQRSRGCAFDIYPLITLCALDVICESAMATSVDAQQGNSDYAKAVNELSYLIHQRMYSIFLRNEMIFYCSRTARRQRELLKILHDFTDKTILLRRKKLMGVRRETDYDKLESTDNDVGARKKMAFLDVLLQSTIDGKPLSNMDIREEVDTFMFEGHDTTSSGIAFCLYNLAKNPQIQEKAFVEIRDVLGDDLKKSITLADLNELKYLELVIKESLRYYPPVPIIGRVAMDDVDVNGKIIPKGCNILISPYLSARDPTVWSEPEKFIPERFSMETDNEKSNPFAYIPFSAGFRNCIGQKFAMLELKSTISKVLRNFQLKVSPDFQPIDVLELITKSSNGIWIELETRGYP